MQKIVSFFVGIGVGILVGGALAALLSPVSGKTFRENLNHHYREALAAGRQAAAEKRTELEAELNQMYEE